MIFRRRDLSATSGESEIRKVQSGEEGGDEGIYITSREMIELMGYLWKNSNDILSICFNHATNICIVAYYKVYFILIKIK